MTVPQHVLASQGTPGSGTTAVIHATVIDATGAPARPDTAIVVEGDRIAALGRTDEVAVPAGARIVDAGGRFVIPGLWDMHVHAFDPGYLPFFLVNGVTGVRHMGAAPVHNEWRNQLTAGKLLAPRMVVGSRIIDGPQPLRPNSLAVTDEADARRAVRSSRADGYDFLKVYNLVPRAAYLTLTDEARRQGMTFAGHVPFAVSAAEASAAGQASIEHLEGVVFAASSHADELHRRLREADPRGFGEIGRVFAELIPRAVATHDPARADELCATFTANRTWQVPTLATLQASAYAGGPDFPLAGYLPYIEPQLRRIWETAREWQSRQPAEQRSHAEQLFQHQLRLVADMHRNGVEVMAGTDTFVPGFSLHDELALLVRAGLSPMEALRAATHHPARFLGVAAVFGTVAEGKIADLVLLEADPLRDIANTRTISAVLLGGRLLDRADLTAMLNTRSGTG